MNEFFIQFLAGLTSLRQVFCGMESDLPDPWKTEVTALRAKIDKVLASIPSESERATAAQDAGRSLNYLTRTIQEAMEMQNHIANTIARMQKQHAAVLAGMPGEIEKAINDRVAAGELITKDAAAKALQDQKARFDLISGRSKSLLTAGLPSPADEVLGAENFDAMQAEAVRRQGVLKEKGVDVAKFGRLVWCGLEDFTAQMALVDSVKAAAKPAAGAGAAGGASAANPMVPGGGDAGAAGGRKVAIIG